MCTDLRLGWAVDVKWERDRGDLTHGKRDKSGKMRNKKRNFLFEFMQDYKQKHTRK